MEPGKYKQFIFLVFLFFFLFLGYFLFLPFFKIVFLSLFIVVILYPLYEKLKSKIKSEILASLTLTLLVLIFIIIPSILIIAVFVNELTKLYPIFINKISKSDSIESFILSIPVISYLHEKIISYLQTLNIKVDIQDFLKTAISYVVNFLISKGRTIFIDFSFIVLGIILMIITIFFLFKDGKNFYIWIYKLIPMEEKEKNYIAVSSYNTIQGIVLGSFLTAIAQGILSFIGYYFSGVGFSLFWAIITFFSAFIPIGGASLIWVPIAVYLFFTKGLIVGILFSLYGTFIISTVDNIIKPIVIGGKANIHPLIMIFAIFGGLNLFGFVGVFIAPIIVVIIYNLLNIFQERYVAG
ncbi:AI-2E family transporter [Hydrogenivirga sp. 128-5-R1-1]|uniref:AI-2E family transporter n=1 Tax=Hydrogenivirga sp. 128-5-R1-1 TaxID=392423 RepID=UPI0005170CEA